MNRQWVPCVCNSSYSFIPVLLKLHICLDHALRCACGVDIILRFIFDTFLQFELSNFSGVVSMKVSGQWVPCVHNFSYCFIQIHLKLYRCLNYALEMHIWFKYNHQIIFITLLQFELSHISGIFTQIK